jgi:hypothetical protein
MMNILPIYKVSRTIEPHRESEREYLIRMARMHHLEERRRNRRRILSRITRGRAAA